ncbi:MAG: hypothetical protein JO235_05270 [Chroococcidiopsidaceae cyanobacterium CP_BM_RX_35]|nr:hypothetical protein [Chroococcidiopsidaceae cyanobacterium CP_BM_RX_35]
MTAPSQATYSRSLRSLQVPPIENGDHFTLIEFERRYSIMLHIKQAELNVDS